MFTNRFQHLSLFYLVLGIRVLFTYVCKKRGTSTKRIPDKYHENKTVIQNPAYAPCFATSDTTIQKTDRTVGHQESFNEEVYEKPIESTATKQDAVPETKTVGTSDEKDLRENKNKIHVD